MNRKEKRIYKRITRMFDNKEPDKDGIRWLDLEHSALCLTENGKLYTNPQKPFTLNSEVVGFGIDDRTLKHLLNELQKY